jgi:RNA polymerase sigma-70 factor (sigma-E family)
VADPAAEFSSYVAARRRALLRTAYLLTGDHHAAEDLVQTALARTYLAWDRIRDAHAVDAYVRRTMVNQHTSWWRRAWRHREVTTGEVPDRPAETNDSWDERVSTLQLLLRGLSPRQRAVLVLRFYEDLTEAEIAHLLGCSLGTVKSASSRALARLRDHLTDAVPAERESS